jgi:hypothetical protein
MTPPITKTHQFTLGLVLCVFSTAITGNTLRFEENDGPPAEASYSGKSKRIKWIDTSSRFPRDEFGVSRGEDIKVDVRLLKRPELTKKHERAVRYLRRRFERIEPVNIRIREISRRPPEVGSKSYDRDINSNELEVLNELDRRTDNIENKRQSVTQTRRIRDFTAPPRLRPED